MTLIERLPSLDLFSSILLHTFSYSIHEEILINFGPIGQQNFKDQKMTAIG